MDSKNKNILIGGLLAIILVMAVGYAAFATQLNINGTATIASEWNVHFDTTKLTGAGIIDTTLGLTGATTPTGSISYNDNLNATLTTSLNQPGDKVVYTLTVKNEGDLSAQAATPNLSISDGGVVNGLIATKGHIKFTVTAPSPNIIAADGNATLTVTAEYTDVEQNETTTTDSATLTVSLNYTQAT